MDRYKKIVKVDKFSLITRTPLPRSNKPKYLSLELSFDNYNKFLSQILGKETQLPLLETEFYDEDIISTDEEFYLRYNFLQVINELNFISVTFNLPRFKYTLLTAVISNSPLADGFIDFAISTT